MAGIDLYGGDAEAIRRAYQTDLGRSASDDEVSNWLTGAFGYNNLNERLSAIGNSGEAQSRRQPRTLGPGDGESHKMDTTPPDAAATQVAQWYQDLLGRSASSDEVTNWLSGTYGWGDRNNLSAIQNAIARSNEALQYGGGKTNTTPPPTTTTTAPYQNTDWWSNQGVPASDIFDMTTGQLKPGWARTKLGYERTGGATTTTTAPKDGNYQAWFQSLVQTLKPSGKNLESLGPTLQQYGIKLGPRNAQGMIDTIILPDGSRWDVIESATLDGGTRWHWIPAGSGGVNVNTPPNQYSDPYTKLLEQLLTGRLQSLMQPVNDPNRAMYESALKSRADALSQAEPQLQKLIDYLESRFTDLQGPGYTGAENETIRTGSLDPIEQDRSAAKKRMAAQLASRNIGPESGAFIEAMRQIDTAFDGMRATTQTTLTTNDLNRREDRKTRAGTIRATLADIPNQRAREQLDVIGMLDQLSAVARAENEARQREAMGLGGALADLGPQRLQLAMQAAGMGGNPSSNFGNLMQLAQLNQQSALFNNQNSSSLWSGLGSLAALLAGVGR